MEIIEQCAWHESGRVVFAYLNGYTCDGIELSSIDNGAGKSRLQGGDDSPYIQALLGGASKSILINNRERAIAVAKKLVRIYCAGSCVRMFQENEGQLDGEAEFDIPGQDLRNLELLQQFLAANVQDHPDDYIQQVVSQIFRDIQAIDVWKPITSLSRQLIKSEGKSFTRFDVEDALMGGGLRPNVKPTKASYDFRVEEEDDKPRKQASPSEGKTHASTELDSALVTFLRMTRQDWSEEELQMSVTYLKALFEKHRS